MNLQVVTSAAFGRASLLLITGVEEKKGSGRPCATLEIAYAANQRREVEI